MDPTDLTVRNNAGENRFEAAVNGHLARIEYRREPGRIAYTHTEVPDALEGQGIGSQMVQSVLNYARENDLEVVAVCPFVKGYIERHPEYQDLVVEQ